MIDGQERLIIIGGMAHSGTTILAYILSQHPKIVCGTSGSEAWILENSWLVDKQADPIIEALKNNPDKIILLKRPWNIYRNSDWMLENIPNAKFICCYRDFHGTANSWSKPGSLVSQEIRDLDIDGKRNFYNSCMRAANAFANKVPHFKKFFHNLLARNPAETMKKLASWLELPRFRYDVSKVVDKIDIKNHLLNIYRQQNS